MLHILNWKDMYRNVPMLNDIGNYLSYLSADKKK